MTCSFPSASPDAYPYERWRTVLGGMQVRKIVEPKAWWRRFWHARVTWRVVREEIRLHSVTVVMDVGDDVVELWALSVAVVCG